MADYAAQASSIYDPQLQAESTALGAENTATQAAFGGETANTNTAYTEALGTAGKARDTAASNNDFVAQTHGLWTSGLAANAQRLTYQTYIDNASKIAEQRAQKLTDIGARQTAATQGYNAKLGVLSSKYGALKNEYITGHQNADAQATAANAARVQAANIAAASRAATASGRQPTAAQTKAATFSDLQSDMGKLFNGFSARPSWYTEDQIIPKLQTLYPELSQKEIYDQAMAYRKSNFGG